MTGASSLASLGFLAGRGLFALVVGYLAVGNLRDLQGSVAYAESKGVPAASLTVPLGSGALLLGAVSVLLGVAPLLGAVAVAGFLASVTPFMHDFWNAEGQAAENEQIHFLKNVGLLGTTLVLLALTTVEQAYALGLGL